MCFSMLVETNCIDAPQARVLTSAFSADRAAPTQENHHRRQEAFVFDDVAFGFFCSAFAALEMKMQEVLFCCGVQDCGGHSGWNTTRQQFHCACLRACHIVQNTVAHRLIMLAGRRSLGPENAGIATCFLHLFGQARYLVITVHKRDRFRTAALRSNFTVPKYCFASETTRAECHCGLGHHAMTSRTSGSCL